MLTALRAYASAVALFRSPLNTGSLAAIGAGPIRRLPGVARIALTPGCILAPFQGAPFAVLGLVAWNAHQMRIKSTKGVARFALTPGCILAPFQGAPFAVLGLVAWNAHQIDKK